MKPLFLTITGINHTCEEFKYYENLLRNQYDIECVTLHSNSLQSVDNFNAFLNTFEPLLSSNRDIVIMAHSFGCIVALYLVQKYGIESKTELIFIDPTTEYMRQHAIRVSTYLGNLLDNAPRNISSPTTVFTYWPQGCTLKTCLEKHIKQHNARVDAIKQLWDNPAHPNIISLYLPSNKLPYIPHNLHRLLPSNISTHISPIVMPMTAGKYKRMHTKKHRYNKRRYSKHRYTSHRK